jgi:putative endonuclease
MEHGRQGGWVYIMADRYRGTMYVGVTAHLAARIHQHRTGDGSDFCRREWKFALIERGNPDWRDLYDQLV